LRPHKAFAGSLPVSLLFLAWTAASAQEPPSLRAAPDAGTVAQEQRDIAGRWLGASDAAVQEFGKAGGTLTDAATGKFTGLSKAIAVADWSSTLGAATGGDVRGAVSGAVAIKVGATAAAGGAALFGEAGAIAGGMVGSFFPVIGNIAGSIVGGAIGAAAGGFITAFGYEKYVKDYVSKGVIAGIASVFDKAPLAEAMEAKRAFLWATMAPEERAQLQVFKPEEVALIDFGTLPYVPVPKQPAPDAKQQAALTTGNVLAGVRKFTIGPLEWTINGGVATHRHVYPGGATSVVTAQGTVTPNRIEGTMVWTFPGDPCHIRQSEHFVLVFDAENVSGRNDPGPVEVRGGCTGWDKMTRGSNFTAPWKVLE
jgi:hypothetical protein